MAFIRYVTRAEIPSEDRVADNDHILRIHGIHSRVTRLHYDLYLELMHADGPLTRVQREMIAVTVSAANGCRY